MGITRLPSASANRRAIRSPTASEDGPSAASLKTKNESDAPIFEVEARYATADYDRARFVVLGRFVPRPGGTLASPHAVRDTRSAEPPCGNASGGVVRRRVSAAHRHGAPRLGPMDARPRRPLAL